jgi:NitT/TauT family transport system substrate-binding protein
MSLRLAIIPLCSVLLLTGACRPKGTTAPSTATSGQIMPKFTLAWSEYPSWSVFGVAHELGLLNGDAGQLGTIEEKYGIDIELKEAGYDTCLNMFGSGDVDAVCITNMDALIVSPSRDGVAVFPTSTSKGADACLVTKAVADIEGLKKVPVYGLKNTVSEYCFARCLELAGFDEKDFNFTNQDPAIAATNMQQEAATHQAIMVWNPFVLQTLRDRSGDVRVLFDSSQIPGEIVDMVVVGADSMRREKADAFVKAVMAAFYAVNEAIEDPAQGDEVLVALGKKFSNLGLDDMRLVVQQTVFYKSPAEAKALLNGEEFKRIMETVTDYCVKHDLVKDPSIGFGPDAGEVKLRFDASWIE